jgi:hypothetical protein
MPHTRRRLLAVGGVSALSLLAGCPSEGIANGNTTTRDSRSTVTVRLVGPDTDRTLFARDAVTAVEEIQEHDSRFSLTATLSDEATSRISNRFESVGVDEDPEPFEVVVLEDGAEVARFGVSPEFAEEVASGGWDGEFRMTFEQRSTARTVRRALT